MTIPAVAFPKLLGFNDLVVVLTMFRRNFNNVLRYCIGFVGNLLDVIGLSGMCRMLLSNFNDFLNFSEFSRTV